MTRYISHRHDGTFPIINAKCIERNYESVSSARENNIFYGMILFHKSTLNTGENAHGLL